MRPISDDLRTRVLGAALSDGSGTRTAAIRFGISRSTAQRWVRRYHATGDVKPLAIGGGASRRSLGERERAVLAEVASGHQDATLAELAAFLAEKIALRVSVTTIFRALAALGITRKKRSSTHRSSSGPT